MAYRKFHGDALFDGNRLRTETVLVTDQWGKVVDLVPLATAGEGIEHFEGTLCPGFINCHCHTELSHLKDIIPPGTGLVTFLISIVRERVRFGGDKSDPIKKGIEELYGAGTAGVADTGNTADALDFKKGDGIRWHQMVEVINLYDANLPKSIDGAQAVLDAHAASGLPGALAPHAPYSVSQLTLSAINERTAGGIISIHNQESAAEDVLFMSGGGDFLKLYEALGLSGSPLPVTGRSSLRSWLPHFTNGQTIILVHNTYTREEDIVFAREHAARHGLALVFCLCPNANLYIENRLPPVQLLQAHGCSIVLGTDSYPSNWQLSMAAEIDTLLKGFPGLSLETALQWATSGGARALRWNDLGTFEKGKMPGIVQLKESEGKLESKRILCLSS